jgi:hypothetical protein
MLLVPGARCGAVDNVLNLTSENVLNFAATVSRGVPKIVEAGRDEPAGTG